MRAVGLVLAAVTVGAFGLQETYLRGNQVDTLDSEDGYLGWRQHRALAKKEDDACDATPLADRLDPLAETCAGLRKVLADDFGNMTTTQQDKALDDMCKAACGKEVDKIAAEWRDSCAKNAKASNSTKTKPPAGKDETADMMSLLMQVGVLSFGCSKSGSGTYCARSYANSISTSAEFCKLTTSCCYGELAKFDYKAAGLVAKAEKKCPGSEAAMATTCAAKSKST